MEINIPLENLFYREALSIVDWKVMCACLFSRKNAMLTHSYASFSSVKFFTYLNPCFDFSSLFVTDFKLNFLKQLRVNTWKHKILRTSRFLRFKFFFSERTFHKILILNGKDSYWLVDFISTIKSWVIFYLITAYSRFNVGCTCIWYYTKVDFY